MTTKTSKANASKRSGTSETTRPNKNWSIDELTQFVKQQFKDRDEMQETLATVGRKSTVALFRGGHALHLMREKLKPISKWEQTLTNEKIAKGTANEAIRLHAKATHLWGATAERELAKRTITEAKYELGVTKKKKELGFPKGPMEQDLDANAPVPPANSTRADEYLAGLLHKLEVVAKWDRSDLDAEQLDWLARRCIKLLDSFVSANKAPMIARIAVKRRHAG